MMSKENFMLMTENEVKLSPAYDLLSTRLLIPEHLDREELALPVNGKKHNINRKDFLVLASSLEIPEKVATSTLDYFIQSLPELSKLINISFLSKVKQGEYLDIVRGRLERLF